MKKNKKREPIQVYIAILTQGTVSIHVADMITKMVVSCVKDKKYEPTIRYSKQTGVAANRNFIVNDFLKSKCEYLIMMDDDNPPLKNPLELIELKKDVMILPTLMYKGDQGKLAFNVFKAIGKDWATMVYDGKNKIFRVERGGTGCVIIKRKVLKRIRKEGKVPFEEKFTEHGLRFIGEDMAFCDKVNEFGYKIWGHWDYCCSHYKTVDLLGIADIIINAKTNENNKESA